MDPLSVTAGTLAIISFTIQHGHLLVAACQHFKNAEHEIVELCVRVEGSWIRINQQLLFLERIVSSLTEEHIRFHDDILGILASKLSLSEAKIQKVIRRTAHGKSYMSVSRFQRVRYVIRRSAIKEVISELEQWQSRFDPSWFLILRIANPIIDEQLSQHQQQRSPQDTEPTSLLERARNPITHATEIRDALRTEPRQHISLFLPAINVDGPDIPYSGARTIQMGRKWYVVERYNCPTGRLLTERNADVRSIARKLACVDPWTFGILNCKGVVKVYDQRRSAIRSFDFIFRVPDSMEVIQSLRQNLLSGELFHSLSRRMTMAKELAKSVGYVHNLNFVHKHICPETILLFQDLQSRFTTFLVGFDNFRAADGGTNLTGDTRWERNIYRHPTRQGEFPEEQYRMEHDIYSLGVCLLEIGLWMSFVSYSSETKPKPVQGQFYQEFTAWLQASGILQPGTTVASPRNQKLVAPLLKQYFVHLADTQLKVLMGEKYSAVVNSCLTCLDDENDDFTEDGSEDESGVAVAVRFLETILQRLNDINV